MSVSINVIPTKINPDLENERRNCTFDVEEMAKFWIGSEQELDEKRAVENLFLNDPELDDPIPSAYLSHKEVYEQAIRKSAVILRKLRKLQENGIDSIDKYFTSLGNLIFGPGIIKDGNPLGLHFIVFIPALLGQSSVEQQGQWLARAWNLEILGTYAQTELGHGTFIRGLETRATYDETTEEFVLHSPTLTSYKWWPGGLGHSSNYAVVVAQLYTKGRCHGIHPFIVQLRDEETWMPLRGIKIGEIGPKLGLKSVDNGYLGFENVRIPRNQMLMKNAQVLTDGTYVKSPSSKLTYGTMTYVRIIVLNDVSNYLSKAVTIATRYSAVRRQSPIDPSETEPQVIDHVMQQYKLFPNIAKVFVIRYVAKQLLAMYNNVTSELNRGDLERLPELHALTCCLKAVCTSDGANGVEQLRLACGGHGYMECSNLPSTYGMVTAACTYEGENTVLLLQTARYLLKSWDWALEGKQLVPTLNYLNNHVNPKTPRWHLTGDGIIGALQTISANKLRLAHTHVQERMNGGRSYGKATNETAIELVQCAEAHCRSFLVQSAYEMVNDTNSKCVPELAIVIQHLVEIYAIDTCLKSIGDILRFTNINEFDIKELQHRLEINLAKIRPNAVGIVDGFDIPDKILCSALGSYDGNVYERLFAEAQKSTLNREPVNQSFHLYLKPFLHSSL